MKKKKRKRPPTVSPSKSHEGLSRHQPASSEPGDKEIVSHVLGPVSPPPGANADLPGEEKRRLIALRAFAQKLAEEHGLTIETTAKYTPDHRQTNRAKIIRELAAPQMAESANEVIQERGAANQRGQIDLNVNAIYSRIRAERNLSASVSSLGNLIKKILAGGIGFHIKMGRFVRAIVSGGTDLE